MTGSAGFFSLGFVTFRPKLDGFLALASIELSSTPASFDSLLIDENGCAPTENA
jgi:hypothetical protein